VNNVKDRGRKKQKEVDLILSHSPQKMKTRRKKKINKKSETNQDKRRKENNQSPNKKF